MCLAIGVARVVAVGHGDQRHAVLLGHGHEDLVDELLFRDLVGVQLGVEPVVVDVLELRQVHQGKLLFALLDVGVQRSPETRCRSDDTGRVLAQQVPVHPRVEIEAGAVGLGARRPDVQQTLLRLCPQHQVVVGVEVLRRAVEAIVHQVRLDTEDRLDACGGGDLLERGVGGTHTVVGNGKGWLVIVRHRLDHLLHLGEAVHGAELRMRVQVYELAGEALLGHSKALSGHISVWRQPMLHPGLPRVLRSVETRRVALLGAPIHELLDAHPADGRVVNQKE